MVILTKERRLNKGLVLVIVLVVAILSSVAIVEALGLSNPSVGMNGTPAKVGVGMEGTSNYLTISRSVIHVSVPIKTISDIIPLLLLAAFIIICMMLVTGSKIDAKVVVFIGFAIFIFWVVLQLIQPLVNDL
jgi:hypothetical protein